MSDEFTPVDRPLMRSDLNDIRAIVQNISERQLEFHAEMRGLTGRVTALEKRLWLPALVSIVAAAFAVLARIAP